MPGGVSVKLKRVSGYEVQSSEVQRFRM